MIYLLPIVWVGKTVERLASSSSPVWIVMKNSQRIESAKQHNDGANRPPGLHADPTLPTSLPTTKEPLISRPEGRSDSVTG